jgi:hypothetical protein
MSTDHSHNPYMASEYAPPAAGWTGQQRGLDYMQSIKFTFDSPNWLPNIFFAVVCNVLGGFVPILPGLVLLGYQCEMLEALLFHPGQPYPDFKTERIMDYLVRGLWPLVIVLIVMVVTVPLVLLALAVPIGAMVLLLSAAGNDGEGLVLFVMIPLIVVIAILAILVCHLLVVPFLLRAALTQDIGESLHFQFAQDFLRRMWKETILAGLFLFAAALVAQTVGLLLFCVGILLLMPVVQFAQVHLLMQLYRLYLARGGEKIPLKSA